MSLDHRKTSNLTLADAGNSSTTPELGIDGHSSTPKTWPYLIMRKWMRNCLRNYLDLSAESSQARANVQFR